MVTLLIYSRINCAGRLSRVAEEIAREEKAQVFAIRIDCADPRSVREAFEGVLSLGFVEVLVYNAYHSSSSYASHHPTSFTHIPFQSFQTSISVSVFAAFLCAQQVTFLEIAIYYIIRNNVFSFEITHVSHGRKNPRTYGFRIAFVRPIILYKTYTC